MDNDKINRKKIFNQGSEEKFMDAKVIGGNPSGIINFNQTPHKFFTKLYKNMVARTWFPEQVNVSVDKINYSQLTDKEKRAYDLVLAQLITNDSIQTNQIMDGINCYITSPVINAALSKQSSEEVVHSNSYAVMAEDICQDTERIYNMHHHDEELRLKNQVVENMYNSLYSAYKDNNNGTYTYTPPSKEDILMIVVANQILESLIFPGGFAVLLSLENKMIGTASMVKEINE